MSYWPDLVFTPCIWGWYSNVGLHPTPKRTRTKDILQTNACKVRDLYLSLSICWIYGGPDSPNWKSLLQRRDLEMVSSESISLADAKRYYRRARHNWLPSALILNAIIYHDCKPYIWVHKLSNLWWMYNSVSKGLGHDIIIGSSQQFQRNTTTYYFKSGLLFCRLG